MRRWNRRNGREQQLEKDISAALLDFDGDPLGAQLQKGDAGNEQYAFVLGDAYKEGRFRVSNYDSKGMYFHEFYESPLDAF